MAEPLTRSALSRFATADGLARWQGDGIDIRELPCTAIIRVQALDDAAAAAAGSAVGVSLPGTGALVSAPGQSIAWVAPREWLVFLAPADESTLLAALSAAGEGVFATPIGDARTGIALSGPRAADVLVRGTGLDLHPDVFGTGRVSNTRLAQLAVMMARPAADDGFHVWVDRSAGAWLWQWLLDAASEFAPDVEGH